MLVVFSFYTLPYNILYFDEIKNSIKIMLFMLQIIYLEYYSYIWFYHFIITVLYFYRENIRLTQVET